MTEPRDVVFTGRGIPPWAMLIAIVVLLGPGIATPFILFAALPGERFDLAACIPSLVWIALGALGIRFSVVAPLRRRRLVAEGVLTQGEIVEVTSSPRSKSSRATVAFTDPDGVARRFEQQTSRAAIVGMKVQVACAPLAPHTATCVDLGVWQIKDPSAPPPPPGVSTARMALALLMTAASMIGMFAAFANQTTLGERTLVPTLFRFLLPLGIGCGIAVAAIHARRTGRKGIVAVMDGFSFVITPLFLLNGTLALNRLLPSEERAVGVFVIANFCLETRSYGTHCMLELAPPRGLEALRLVRDRTRKASEAPSRVGERIDLTLSPGALGIPSIRADGFSAMQDWEPTPEIEGMFISKRATLAKLIQDGQVSARGHFSEGSVARAELRSLGIPTR